MKKGYGHTLAAAYIGYIVQSMVINFPPLLFAAFSEQFHISVTGISLLISINFCTQLVTDLAAARYINKIGYRRGAVLAHLFAVAGFLLLSFLPFVIPAYAGLCISTVIMAIGGGLTEVVISPIVQELPLKNKASHMSLLHSFFCWGFVMTVLLSTAFFALFGIDNWRYLALLFSVIPFCGLVMFFYVPLVEQKNTESQTGSRKLLATPAFLLMLLMMLCGGASEIAMSQWASYFAQLGLDVTKTVGDLLGPCSFAVLMGLARLFFAKNEKRINLNTALIISSVLCIVSYLLAGLSPFPVLSLIGCSLCGLSVGLMWPGTLSLCAERFPSGGGKMFAMLAFAGDVGCVLGPFLLGVLSDLTGDLKIGILFVIIFPVIMLSGLIKEKLKNVG
ncbi:MAG: MFS transporter [Clostridia bacterium]|nr:MFS transporter [Clostridia bacterium]